MKKGIKILFLAATVFFLLTGAASAVTFMGPVITDDDGNIMADYSNLSWASLDVQVTGEPNAWTYQFSLKVLAGDKTYATFLESNPSVQHTAIVHQLDIPIIAGGISGVQLGGVDVYYVGSFQGEGFLSVLFGDLTHDFDDPDYHDGLLPDQTAVVTFNSPNAPGWGTAILYNTGTTSETCSKSALVAPAGGDSSVPEPTTLILVGIGILGVGAYRRLSARGRA